MVFGDDTYVHRFNVPLSGHTPALLPAEPAAGGL